MLTKRKTSNYRGNKKERKSKKHGSCKELFEKRKKEWVYSSINNKCALKLEFLSTCLQ